MQPADNWQHQELSRKSADVTMALAANKLAGILADYLKARGIIGQPVFEQATNYAVGVTEYARVQYLVTAVLTKTKYNPQCYHDFIQTLELDGIRPDTEAARSLLPKGSFIVSLFFIQSTIYLFWCDCFFPPIQQLQLPLLPLLVKKTQGSIVYIVSYVLSLVAASHKIQGVSPFKGGPLP